ncbi:MAG TPA: BON domain-containing protein [Burkholderiales bacterium]|jgi:osmotically-inducible protein OsmY|nr:BON domain-containing protein [Burkholderiales bacterium]
MEALLRHCRWFIPAVLGVFLVACAGGESKRATGEYVDDKVISTKVKTNLGTELGAGSAVDIQVETYKGTVQLSGFVKTQEEKQKATEIAKKVTGVEKVVNNIALRKAQ